MTFCKYCGQELNDGAAFCGKCGKSQKEESKPLFPPEDNEDIVTSKIPAEDMSGQKKDTSVKGIVIGIIIGAAVVGIIAAAFIIFPKILGNNNPAPASSAPASVASTQAEPKSSAAPSSGQPVDSSSQASIKPSQSGQPVGGSVLERDYILPESNQRILTDADIEGLTAEELGYATNEIYARHGRRFTTEKYQKHFESKSWYTGTVDADKFNAKVLSEIEQTNANWLRDKTTEKQKAEQ